MGNDFNVVCLLDSDHFGAKLEDSKRLITEAACSDGNIQFFIEEAYKIATAGYLVCLLWLFGRTDGALLWLLQQRRAGETESKRYGRYHPQHSRTGGKQ